MSENGEQGPSGNTDRSPKQETCTGMDVSALLRSNRGRTAVLATSLFDEESEGSHSQLIQRGTIADVLVDGGTYPEGVSDIRALQVYRSTLEQNGSTTPQGNTFWGIPGSTETAQVTTSEDGTVVKWGEEIEGAIYELTIPQI
jgi:hypothetical protein